MLTGQQIRMALAALKWSLDELASKSGVSWQTARRAASVAGVPSTSARNLDAIQRALEGAGIIFIEADSEGGAGARLAAK